MDIEVMGVYLVDFKENIGAEFSGNHYAVVLTEQTDNTFIVVPMTSKKPFKRYKHGITIDNKQYLEQPKYEKAFILVRKLREVDRKRIKGQKRYSLTDDDIVRLKNKVKEILKLKD